MNIIKSSVILALSVFSMTLQAADFTVYWSTDGASSQGVNGLAQQFQSALKQQADIEAKVVVASAKTVSQVAQQADLLITCNEVDSRYGAPVLRLSDKEIENLSCVGGDNQGQWALAADHGVNRHSSGEYWVYFMRNSQHFSQYLNVREAMHRIKQDLKLETIMTASVQ